LCLLIGSPTDYNTVTFGKGNGDYVLATAGDIQYNTITFGSGADDYVSATAGDIRVIALLMPAVRCLGLADLRRRPMGRGA
jgi:hypothetical protein